MKKTKTVLSVKTKHRLKAIMREMAKHPDQVVMHTFFDSSDAVGNPAGGCGTAGCIGGWAMALFYRGKPAARKIGDVAKLVERSDEWLHACRALGLRQDSGEDDRGYTAPGRLMALDDWPPKYQNAYDDAKTAKGKAGAVIRRIKHFIKTDGKE